MKPNWYALNVGRGDAFFLDIPIGQAEWNDRSLNRSLDNRNSFLVLVDGGDERLPGYTFPLEFMREQNRQQVDLLILTHLHHDHIVGLLPVAKHAKVIEAILPYPKFAFERIAGIESRNGQDVWEPKHPKAKQSLEVMQLYQELFELLERQETVIHLRPPFAEQSEWLIGDWKLRHLAPVAGDELPAYQIILDLIDDPLLSAEERESRLIRFDDMSNLDSSVWLLEQEESKEQLLLLGGDALLPVWERVLQREQLAPAVLKVSHHGMDDAIHPDIVDRLKPDWLLITNRQADAEFFAEDWQQLTAKTGSGLFVTGEETTTRWLVSELPAKPIRVK